MGHQDDLRDARESSRLEWTVGLVSFAAAAGAVMLFAALL
jgi:hypothetical protein